MSLEYGFGLYETDPAARTILNEKFEALSDVDKKFFEQLCFILMIVDIGTVSEQTIPHIVARLDLANPQLLKNYENLNVFCEYLKKFIGYQANVITEDTGAFIKKRAKNWRTRLPKLSKKQALDTRPFETALVDLIPADRLLEFSNKEWRQSKVKARYQERLAAGV